MATPAARLVVSLLVLVSVASQVVHVDALWLGLLSTGTWTGATSPDFLTVAVSDAVLTVVAGVAAVLLAFRWSERPGARSLSVVLAVWGYLLAYTAVGTLARPDGPGTASRLLFDGHFFLVEMAGLAALVVFSSSLPRRLERGDLSPDDELPAVARPFQTLRRAVLPPGAAWAACGGLYLTVLAVNAALGRAVQDAALLPLVDLIRVAALAVVVANLRRGWRIARPDERTRLVWVASGFALLLASLGVIIGGNVLLAVTDVTVPVNWRPAVLGLGVAAFMLGGAATVHGGGRVDPRVLGARATTLAVVAPGALLLAAALEALLSGAVITRLALPTGTGSLAALLVVGVLLPRTRAVLDRAVASG